MMSWDFVYIAFRSPISPIFLHAVHFPTIFYDELIFKNIYISLYCTD